MCGLPLQTPAGCGGAHPHPEHVKNMDTEEGKPSSHLSLFMEELGQNTVTSLGLEVSFCEMGERGLVS